MNKHNVQIFIQHSPADLPAPPEEDSEWLQWGDSPKFWLNQDGEDNGWISKIIKKFRAAVKSYSSHWWRIVISHDEGIVTTEGFIHTGSGKLLVLAGPYRAHSMGNLPPETAPSFPTDENGYYVLNVRLPDGLAGEEYLGNEVNEEDAPVAGEFKPGEDVEEASDTTEQNALIVDEDGKVSLGTLEHNSDTIPSGTQVEAVDEFGQKHTVTVL